VLNLKRSLCFFLAFFIFSALTGCTAGFTVGEESPKIDQNTSERIDAIFDPLISADSPGFAVMVIRDGEVIHSKGYGLADLEHRIPMSPQTSIRLASVSKQFTAFGIMLLSNEGKLNYDDSASKYIPELSKRFNTTITIRHLMNHTSGLPDYYDEVPKLFPGEKMPTISDGAAVFAKWGETRFAPGDRFEYSNPGYEMLGLIIERVSGLDYPVFMEEKIFQPLEMNQSLVLDQPDVHFENRAYGYQKPKNKWIKHDLNRLNLMFGAGGIYTSLDDLVKWENSLVKGTLIPVSDINEAFTPGILNSGEKTDYGFGWRINSYKGYKRFAHTGGWVGFRTMIARFPELKLTVVVLGNRGDQNTRILLDRVVDKFLEEKNQKN
jgi:CubicO group peptidase (beta-lactamase class C family)